ncbi:hypothetical protein BIWAKO_04112 [Bosea sp. BIWAKO-01]|nr:hypothetical protein BIWAKO_04112 [Bosea sp. BIWAKO-01]
MRPLGNHWGFDQTAPDRVSGFHAARQSMNYVVEALRNNPELAIFLTSRSAS